MGVGREHSPIVLSRPGISMTSASKDGHAARRSLRTEDALGDGTEGWMGWRIEQKSMARIQAAVLCKMGTGQSEAGVEHGDEDGHSDQTWAERHVGHVCCYTREDRVGEGFRRAMKKDKAKGLRRRETWYAQGLGKAQKRPSEGRIWDGRLTGTAAKGVSYTVYSRVVWIEQGS